MESRPHLRRLDFENQENITDQCPLCWEVSTPVVTLMTVMSACAQFRSYFNYKKYFSIILPATCDLNYQLTMCDIEAYGSKSDCVILNNSIFGRKLHENSLNLSSSTSLPGNGPVLPHFFLGERGVTSPQ